MEENKNQPRHKVDIREMTIDDETTLRQICDRCEDALAGCGESRRRRSQDGRHRVRQ